MFRSGIIANITMTRVPGRQCKQRGPKIQHLVVALDKTTGVT